MTNKINETFFRKLKRINKTKFKLLAGKEKLIKVVLLVVKLAVIAALVVAVGLLALMIAIPIILVGGMSDAVQGEANRQMKNPWYIKY